MQALSFVGQRPKIQKQISEQDLISLEEVTSRASKSFMDGN